MSDSTILARIGGRAPEERSELDPRLDAEPWDDLGCFGWLRGIRDRSTMLELRKKDGNILAVGYGWLERVQFDPSEGIRLHIGGQTILIKGRNLNAQVRPTVRLFEGITRHRVPWVQEADQLMQFEASTQVAVVDSIDW